MPANPAHGKFTASQHTGEFAGTAYSQPLSDMKKKKKSNVVRKRNAKSVVCEGIYLENLNEEFFASELIF